MNTHIARAAMAALLLAGCSSSDDADTTEAPDPASEAETTAEPATTTTIGATDDCVDAVEDALRPNPHAFLVLADCDDLNEVQAAMDQAGTPATTNEAARLVKVICSNTSTGVQGRWLESGPICREAGRELGET